GGRGGCAGACQRQPDRDAAAALDDLSGARRPERPALDIWDEPARQPSGGAAGRLPVLEANRAAEQQPLAGSRHRDVVDTPLLGCLAYAQAIEQRAVVECLGRTGALDVR